MDFLNDVLVFLHFLGLAALFGGLFTQLRADRRVTSQAVNCRLLHRCRRGLTDVLIKAPGPA